MTIDEIRNLVTLVQETRIAELELQLGNDRVRIVNTLPLRQDVVLPTVMPVSLASASAAAVGTHSQFPVSEVPPTVTGASPEEPEENNLVVKSPIVGTYFDSPSPGSPPFVKVGDRIQEKQVLCIIESMKLMNEIEADVAGVVIAKHVDNGRPIEYGETLFTIRPQ